MNRPSNTPPDGDFVRYVEHLTSANANARAAAQSASADAARRTSAPVRAQPATVMAPGNPPGDSAAKPIASALKSVPFFTHVKWVLGLWIATQALGRGVAWAGFLFIPALLAYAAWVLFNVNQQTRGGLWSPTLEKLRQAARDAEKRGQSGP